LGSEKFRKSMNLHIEDGLLVITKLKSAGNGWRGKEAQVKSPMGKAWGAAGERMGGNEDEGKKPILWTCWTGGGKENAEKVEQPI